MKKVSTVAAKPSKKISQQKLTVGLDLGDRNSWYCVLDEAGQVQLEQRVRTNEKALREVFGTMRRSRIAKPSSVTALMAWPRFHSEERNHRAPNRWQHRLNRERPACTERNDSLLESADGSMATAANGRDRKSMSNEKTQEST